MNDLELFLSNWVMREQVVVLAAILGCWLADLFPPWRH